MYKWVFMKNGFFIGSFYILKAILGFYKTFKIKEVGKKGLP